MKHLNERILAKYFDGELSEKEAANIVKHLEDCPRCRDEYELLVGLSEELNTLPAVKPPPYFTSRVKRIAIGMRKPRLSLRVLVPITATTATLVSLVIGGYLGQSLYSEWLGNGTNDENGYVDYFDVPSMQDYPEGSFGEVFTDFIPEEVEDEG